MKKLAHTIGLVAVNLIVVVVLLGAVEFYFRIWGHENRQDLPNGLWQTFQPYVMITTVPGKYPQFFNTFTNETYASAVQTNSLGFNDPHEFSLTAPYRKAANEKVVLFTGGSAAWGVGATATDRTVAGRMQYYLNSLQNGERYTVVNLAMGSWIAIQQFIGLQLWGPQFDPDWVVSMDGFNDAGTGCGYSQGVGNPLYYATMRSYINGYLMSTMHPVFYRGWLENEIIRYSAAYRIITGKEYVRDDQVFDRSSNETMPIRRQIIPTKMGDSRQMLAFYIDAERGMLKLFPQAKYILSTQPVVNQFTGDFNDIYQYPAGSAERKAAIDQRTTALEGYLTQHENEQCTQQAAQPSFTYIFGNGAVQLEQLVDAQAAKGRQVAYYNIGTLFPDARQDRMPFFIDPPHLSDKGMDVIGKFYAERILAIDHKERPAAAAFAPAVAAAAPAATPEAGPRTWNFLVGLTLKDETTEQPVMAGFQPLRLTATPTDSRHVLGDRFADLTHGSTYRVTVWLKPATATGAQIEGRDSNDSETGRPRHYGVASFDLSQGAVGKSSGDMTNLSIIRASNGWLKATFDLVTEDGQIYVTAGLLDGSEGQHVFHGEGQSIVLGGIALEERK